MRKTEKWREWISSALVARHFSQRFFTTLYVYTCTYIDPKYLYQMIWTVKWAAVYHIESIREKKLNFFVFVLLLLYNNLLANKQTNICLHICITVWVGHSFQFEHFVTCFPPTTFEQKRKCTVKLYNLHLNLYSHSPVSVFW